MDGSKPVDRWQRWRRRFTFHVLFSSFAIPRTVAILAAAMSVDDDADTSEAHQVQAIQDIETLGDSVLRTL